MNKTFYFNVYKALISADLKVFKQSLLDKCIDVGIWVILTVVVTGYVMQHFGLARDFGPFQFAGIIAAIGLFELYGNAVELVSDFEGDRVINYNLTLPIPSWLAITSKASFYFIVYCILTLIMFPLGKICLWNQLDLAQINYFKFTLILIAQNIFYACFLLWAASIIANMAKLGSIWARYIFPMWFMGGFQFSQFALLNAIPCLAYINFLNPMIYITEGARAAMLGQTGYINFWLCFIATLAFASLALALGMRNLKKRLDFV
ncbi:ABC transporter permease [Candidatus Dependentiae bacterium]|nr:ABC transporter permease [Candidatus Dependentiae bacterium]